LLSDRKVNETLKLMERPAGDRLTPEVTREVCQRTGSKAMLNGSIVGLGNQYVIGLKAVNCNTGDVLAEAQEQAAGKERVLKALDDAAVSLRGRLGESLSSVQKYATPLEEATTPSLEALKAYSLGTKTGYAKGTAALRGAEAGNREPVLAEAKAALKLAPNRDVRAIAALALARAGDPAGAEKLTAELDKAFPLSTLVQRYWLPTIRAAVALHRKDPNRAIELLKVASTVELGMPANLNIFLCPVYLRGEAYLTLHDGNRAAAEFQKFIDHRGVVMNFPWGALARLGLARAYTMQGDRAKAKAKATYQDFLTLWKDADPDVPILIAAKAEYSKLQ
jgi:hypothetical protein